MQFNLSRNHLWSITSPLKGSGLLLALCEAPFVVHLYDPVDGRTIPLDERSGFLDRKMRAIQKHGPTKDLAFAALKSCYGYEWSGDNLYLARMNVWNDFHDWIKAFGIELTESDEQELVNIITWNFWQMDGLKGTVPFSGEDCLLMDWQNVEVFKYKDLLKGDDAK